MMKTQPQFHLDRSFKGPFIVKTVTPTNAVIQLKGDNSAELINVSRQRLSKCNVGMEDSTPWVGHSNKCRRIRTRKAPVQQRDSAAQIRAHEVPDTSGPAEPPRLPRPWPGHFSVSL